MLLFLHRISVRLIDLRNKRKGKRDYFWGALFNFLLVSLLSVGDLMGNNIRRRRQMVDEKYTRPQGMYRHREIDYKKLRKLILESKLAPCYPGLEEYAYDLEECPICFLYYPSLNRSRCCMKGICTDAPSVKLQTMRWNTMVQRRKRKRAWSKSKSRRL